MGMMDGVRAGKDLYATFDTTEDGLSHTTEGVILVPSYLVSSHTDYLSEMSDQVVAKVGVNSVIGMMPFLV